MGNNRVGDLYRIELDAELYAYAQALEEPLVHFFEYSTASPEISPGDVLSAGVAFTIWVMNSALSSENWEKLGNYAVTPGRQENPQFFKQDKISGKLELYDGQDYRDALVEECGGAEPAAVWGASHVEDRLRDHFAGVPNKWVESMKIRV